MISFSHDRTFAQSLSEYGRGVAGGLMFAMPLLFTMEVWYAGILLEPVRIMIYVACTFGLLIFYNRFVGLREDATFLEVVIDSVEEMGIGIVLSALVLWLAGMIDATMNSREIIGTVVMEAMTVAIGVSIGTAQLGGPSGNDDGVKNDKDSVARKYLPQTTIAFCGAILFAANIAPTDEMKVIAMEIPAGRLILVAAFSLFLATLILHFSEFRGASTFGLNGSLLLKIRGVITTYAVALSASAAALWFFGKFDHQPLFIIVAETVVLGLPAVLGASAGRFLLQSSHSKSSS